jgi:hypothetical protein
MSQENYAGTLAVSMPAGGTITRNALLILNASGQVIVSTAITDVIFGVAQQDAVLGDQVPVLTAHGVLVTLVASAAIAIGAQVMPGASGRAATVAGVTAITCAQAISAAAANGDLFFAKLTPGVRSPANV